MELHYQHPPNTISEKSVLRESTSLYSSCWRSTFGELGIVDNLSSSN